MESVTTLLGEWNSFGSVCSTDEADFMAQLLGDFLLPNDLANAPPFLAPLPFWPLREAAMPWSENTNPSPESSYLEGDNSVRFLASKGKTRLPSAPPRAHEKSVSSSSLLSDTTLTEGEEGNPSAENSLSPSSRKRSNMVDKSTETMKPRKSLKLFSKGNGHKADHDAFCRQVTKIYGSDDDSNWSQDVIASPRPNGKTRAGRGSATDPQSVYARKRRERINERLRILQSLVPNGTKVDISTMLEEAVQYVKFLQLQIKLLSSDELWMYARIAYNGMELGLGLGLGLKTPSPR